MSKIKFFEYYRNPDKLTDPVTGTDVIFLQDGDLELPRCQRAKSDTNGKGQLFCSRNKRWFHLKSNGKLTEIRHLFSPALRIPGRHCHNGKRGCCYPQMRHFSKINCHVLVYEAWIGERHYPLKEIDHKNGDVLDYSVDNLEEVTPPENSWRSIHVLKVLRAKNIDPTTYTGSQMDRWFAIFRQLERDDIKTSDLSQSQLTNLFINSLIH